MGINSYADIIHQNTSWVIAGNWWMRDAVEKSVFITGKLNHRPPFCSVPSIYICIWLKHLYQYFESLDTVRKSFLNEAADFHVCMWVSEHKKNKKNDCIVHNVCDFTKQMFSNEQMISLDDIIRIHMYATPWGWDKMAVISQTTFSNIYSWMKMNFEHCSTKPCSYGSN